MDPYEYIAVVYPDTPGGLASGKWVGPKVIGAHNQKDAEEKAAAAEADGNLNVEVRIVRGPRELTGG